MARRAALAAKPLAGGSYARRLATETEGLPARGIAIAPFVNLYGSFVSAFF